MEAKYLIAHQLLDIYHFYKDKDEDFSNLCLEKLNNLDQGFKVINDPKENEQSISEVETKEQDVVWPKLSPKPMIKTEENTKLDDQTSEHSGIIPRSPSISSSLSFSSVNWPKIVAKNLNNPSNTKYMMNIQCANYHWVSNLRSKCKIQIKDSASQDFLLKVNKDETKVMLGVIQKETVKWFEISSQEKLISFLDVHENPTYLKIKLMICENPSESN